MEQQLSEHLKNLQNIFKNKPDPNSIKILLAILYFTKDFYPGILHLETEEHQPKYFSLVQISKPSPVVVAGALARNIEREIVPAIRFLKINISLKNVPDQYKFLYKVNPDWMYVELHEKTITFFPCLLESQVRIYLQHK